MVHSNEGETRYHRAMLPRVLAVASVAWLAAILLAPLAIASDRPMLSAGAVGLYAAGARICHQRPDRCFWIHGRPMPVCARCSGLYAGAAFAAPLALVWAARLSGRRARLVLAAAALPTLVTWSLEMAGRAHPSNIARLVAALPLGFAAAWLVVSTLSNGSRPNHKDH
jgi:uncharacterized membrane protein